MTVGWFPRFNIDASLLTWQREFYWRAQFIDAKREIADNGTHLVIAGQPIAAPSCNELSAGGGIWAAFRPDPVRVYTSLNQTIFGAGVPSVNPDGKLAYVDARQSPIKNLIFENVPIARGAITDIRSSRTAIVWLDYGQTWGMRIDRPDAVRKIQVAPWEGGPVPIDTPNGPWVGCYTQTGIILRPMGETMGYRFDNGGQCYYPDWAAPNATTVVAVFTNDNGVQSQHTFDLTAPRIPLGATEKVPGPISMAIKGATMSTERGGLVGAAGKFARADKNKPGIFPGTGAVVVDGNSSDGAYEWEMSDRGDGTFNLNHVASGAGWFLEMDATQYSGGLDKQYYIKQSDGSGYAALAVQQEPDGTVAVFKKYDDPRPFEAAQLVWVKK